MGNWVSHGYGYIHIRFIDFFILKNNYGGTTDLRLNGAVRIKYYVRTEASRDLELNVPHIFLDSIHKHESPFTELLLCDWMHSLSLQVEMILFGIECSPYFSWFHTWAWKPIHWNIIVWLNALSLSIVCVCVYNWVRERAKRETSISASVSKELMSSPEPY